MLQTSLLRYLRSRGHEDAALKYVLPRMIKHFGAEFRIFADCGAGIGYTASEYSRLLSSILTEEDFSGAAIYCYEPLPENIAELTARLKTVQSAVLRPVAVGDAHGPQIFSVPRRMTGSGAAWGTGTSALGFLGAASGSETVTVDVVRLEDEPVERFDFIKLDLQGGERKALAGLGKKLHEAKLIYAEIQLFANPDTEALRFLQDAGFICFYDKLLFGVRMSSPEVPLRLLSEAGIIVESIKPPDGRGMSKDYVLTGRLDIESTQALTPEGMLSADIARRLLDAGVFYIASDILAVNPLHHKDFLRIL